MRFWNWFWVVIGFTSLVFLWLIFPASGVNFTKYHLTREMFVLVSGFVAGYLWPTIRRGFL